MFSTNSQIDTLADLVREVRAYIDARYRYVRLDCVAKLSTLLSALVLGIIFAVLMAVALLFLAYTLSLAMAPYVGGMHVACAIVAAACLLLGVIVYLLRRWLIVRPITAFIARVLLNDDEQSDEAASTKSDASKDEGREERL